MRKNYLKSIFLGLIFVCLPGWALMPLYAQKQGITIQKVNGALSQNTIATIAQDELGFLWFGTQYGLNCFDGIDFINYQYTLNDSSFIEDEAIESLLPDGNGNLWIGTYGDGISLFNNFTKTFSRPDPELNKAGKYITELYQDSEGLIWIGTYKKGLSCFNPETGEFKSYLKSDHGHPALEAENITSVCEDDQQNLWIGSWESGLHLLRAKQGSGKERAFHSPISFLEGEFIRCLHEGKQGRIWVGMPKGLREIVFRDNAYFIEPFDFPESDLAEELNNSSVLSILESQGKLWIGTENKGLFVYDFSNRTLELYKKSDQTLDDQIGLNGNSIWSLFSDADGSVWIGSYFSGLNKVEPQAQKFSSVLKAVFEEKTIDLNLVSSFVEDNLGNVWFGTDGSGLFCYDSEAERFLKQLDKSTDGRLSSNEVVALMKDREGNIWVGTWSGGVNVVKNGGEIIEQFMHVPGQANSLMGNDIHDIYQDGQGRIWISIFHKGLDCYDPKTKRFTHFKRNAGKRSILSQNIRKIMGDAEGNIWLGTEAHGVERITLDEGLNIVESKRFLSADDKRDRHGKRINTIYLDQAEQIWIGSSGEGLFKYLDEQDTLIQFSVEDGLPSNLIYAITNDNSNRLWGSTNRGLFCMKMEDMSIQKFTIDDHLQSNEFYRKSSLKKSNGELFFGGVNGFNQFYAENALGNKNNLPPNVYITALTTSNHKKEPSESDRVDGIFNGKHIDLAHWQNDMSFRFTATNYIRPEKNQYKFKLENYDKGFREMKGDRMANYTNIPPGDYIFRVIASNNDGIWNMKGAELYIHIAKPWYASHLAFIIYGLIIIGLLTWARNNLIVRERLKAELEWEHLERKKIQEVDELKSQFFANISHEFKTPLTLIMTPTRALIDQNPHSTNLKHYQMVLDNSERLLKLVNQIMDLARIESGNMELSVAEQDIVAFLKTIALNFSNYADIHHIDYEMVFPEHEVMVYFEKEKLEKVFVNLLSNAFKFTRKFGKVVVHLLDKEDSLEIYIKDNGKGVHPDEYELIFNRFYKAGNGEVNLGTGIGLSLAKQMVEFHHGNIELDNTNQEGASFVVTMRKGCAHFNESQIVTTPRKFSYSPESLIAMNEFSTNDTSVKGVEENAHEEATLLLVEDNPDLRAFITNFLSAKYTVLLASNGFEGLQMAREYQPDVVITDVVMPKMDGYELCKLLKEDPRTSHMFVIMLTVKSAAESMEKALNLGVDHYLTKPFNPTMLDLHLQNMLKSRQGFKRQLLSRQNVKLEPNAKPTAYSERDEKFLKDLIVAIEENMKDPGFKIDVLCRNLGLSKSQLYRRLKSLAGQSANEFIRGIRLKKAAQLIRQNKYKVSEITYMVGFNDLHYFRDCFKAHYGMTPSSYAKHSKEEAKS